MNYLIERIIQNPKSSITALGLISVVVAIYAQQYPHVQILAATAAAISAVYKLLGTDSGQK